MKTIIYFTKKQLLEVAKNGRKWRFNRQIRHKDVRRLEVARYPVRLHFVHQHRIIRRCEDHMRCVVWTPSCDLIFDVPMEFFERLDSVHWDGKKVAA